MLSSEQTLKLLHLKTDSEDDIRVVLKQINGRIGKLTENPDSMGKIAEALTEYLYVRTHYETMLRSTVDGTIFSTELSQVHILHFNVNRA